MRKLVLILIILLSFCIPLISYSQTKLPECKTTDKVLYHNCYGKKFYGRDGKYYEAEFKNNLPVGEVKFSSGDKYNGGWNDQGYHGEGIYTHLDGSKYVGEYKNGKAHGKGTYTHLNGDKYVGEYKNGKKHGKGTFTFKNGSKYEGKFENGDFVKGEIYHFNSFNYVGDSKNGVPNGKGILTGKDGQKEIGSFNSRW
jgi:hypothetical protein